MCREITVNTRPAIGEEKTPPPPCRWYRILCTARKTNPHHNQNAATTVPRSISARDDDIGRGAPIGRPPGWRGDTRLSCSFLAMSLFLCARKPRLSFPRIFRTRRHGRRHEEGEEIRPIRGEHTYTHTHTQTRARTRRERRRRRRLTRRSFSVRERATTGCCWLASVYCTRERARARTHTHKRAYTRRKNGTQRKTHRAPVCVCARDVCTPHHRRGRWRRRHHRRRRLSSVSARRPVHSRYAAPPVKTQNPSRSRYAHAHARAGRDPLSLVLSLEWEMFFHWRRRRRRRHSRDSAASPPPPPAAKNSRRFLVNISIE